MKVPGGSERKYTELSEQVSTFTFPPPPHSHTHPHMHTRTHPHTHTHTHTVSQTALVRTSRRNVSPFTHCMMSSYARSKYSRSPSLMVRRLGTVEWITGTHLVGPGKREEGEVQM